MQSEKTQIEASLAKQSLVAANNLQYSLKPDLSVCTSRTSTAQFFQNSQYSEGSNMKLHSQHWECLCIRAQLLACA